MSRWFLVSVILTVAAFAVSIYVFTFEYDRLPERLPIHWNIQGEPDGWVNKENGLWAFLLGPGVMAAMVLLTVLLPWLSPQGFDPERFRGTWDYFMMLVVVLFAYLNGLIVYSMMHPQNLFDLGRWMVAGIFLFFVFMGNVLGQVRRNFWMGVRTPWTLASENVWNQTHRVTAWIFVVTGLLGAIAVVVGVPMAWCFVAFILVIVTIPIGYSFVLYKRLEKLGKL